MPSKTLSSSSQELTGTFCRTTMYCCGMALPYILYILACKLDLCGLPKEKGEMIASVKKNPKK